MSTSSDVVVPTTLPIQPEVIAPELITPAHYVFPALLMIVGLGVAVGAGVFRSGSINGPDRLDLRRPAWPLLLAFLVGLGAWLGTQVLYVGARQAERMASGLSAPITSADLSVHDMAFLSTVPFAIGLVTLLAGDALVIRFIGANLGLRAAVLPRGFGRGVIGMLILMPMMIFGSVALEHLYQLVGYEHPSAHELLTVMKQAQRPREVALLIFGATVMAPAFEELLFRGHLQTLLRRLFANRPIRVLVPPPPVPEGVMVAREGAPAGSAPPAPPARELIPVPPPSVVVAPSTMPYASPPTIRYDPPAPDLAWQRWAAVIATSFVFAFVHPLWSMPLIFVLSLGLGYAYERTGNLWVPITMHLLFNTIQTTFFLLMNR